tara:strand:- start:444 stop:1682 length:1239 start_codon:yes stop_codon:yes gene_type:complete
MLIEKIKNHNLLFYVLFLIFYSISLNPTPQSIGYLQLVILIFFILFCVPALITYLKNLLKFQKLEKSIFIIFVYLIFQYYFLTKFDFRELCFYTDLDNKQIVRDLIGFCYFFIPYVFVKNFEKIELKKVIFATSIISIFGVLFLNLYNQYLVDAYKYYYFNSLHPYNDPLYLFGLSFLLLYSFKDIKNNNLNTIFIFIFLNIIFIFYAVYLYTASNKLAILQYCFLVSIIICNLLYKNKKLIIIFKHLTNKKKYFFYTLMILLLLIFLIFFNRFDNLLSSRFIEIIETKDILFYDYLNMMFGLGIGSEFYISYFGREVSFIHIFVYYILLKIGLIGITLLIFYFHNILNFSKYNFFNFYKLFKIKKNNVIFTASLIILLGGFFVYTYYKYLSFWIIVSLVILEQKKIRNEIL